MSRAPIIAAALAAAAVALLAGCGDERSDTGSAVVTVETERPAQGSPADRDQTQTVAPAKCPPEAGPGCAEAEGRIVFVEAVDPDGDGDAHFVIVDSGSITLPGLTAIDIRKGLRPEPLPGVGDLVAAAGPVQTGSHGQSQIHALTLNVAAPAKGD